MKKDLSELQIPDHFTLPMGVIDNKDLIDKNPCVGAMSTTKIINEILERYSLDREKTIVDSHKLLKIIPKVSWEITAYGFDSCHNSNNCKWEDSDTQHSCKGYVCMNIFAPYFDKLIYNEHISTVIINKKFIKFVDETLENLKHFPKHGELFHKILDEKYIKMNELNENTIFEKFGICKSTFFKRKEEAVLLFGTMLFGKISDNKQKSIITVNLLK